jgi:hypothetical protein
MLARTYSCLILSAALFASASAEPGTTGSVTVETDLARKPAAATPKPSPVAMKVERKAADRIWSGVILATNPDVPKPIPKELHEFEATLKRIFGYGQFEIIGTATEPIDEESEHWLLPVHHFSLEFTAHHMVSREARGGYVLDVQLFQEKRSLVAAELRLAPSSPTFIRGPGCGKGQIIIIVQVQH